jgi:hypothetical protein
MLFEFAVFHRGRCKQFEKVQPTNPVLRWQDISILLRANTDFFICLLLKIHLLELVPADLPQ